MKWIKRLAIAIPVVFLLAVVIHLFYIRSLSPKEVYPADKYLDASPVKKALIVTAHDDDAYSVSGTVMKLISEGWEVSQICFKRIEEPEKNELFQKIAQKEGLKEVIFLDMPFRKTKPEAPYMPVPYAEFAGMYDIDTVYNALAGHIDRIRPAVIFTLDDVIGGYGHPEHVMISQQVHAYCDNNKTREEFPVKRIYQAVFTPTMSESIMVRASRARPNTYLQGKKIYGCDGMPEPTTQVDIYSFAERKKEMMNSFSAHDRKNIAKTLPYYNWYPYWIYFRIFDQEYFRVLSFNG